MRIVLAAILFVLTLPLHAGAEETEITFDRMESIARKWDDVYDAIPRTAYPVLHTQEELDAWVSEIVPYFLYEQVVSDKSVPGNGYGLKYPSKIGFFEACEGPLPGQNEISKECAQDNMHTMAMADCLNGSITINERLVNPSSPFFLKEDVLLVLVHELAHVQGICFGGEAIDSEVSAQLVSLEVLSAMANDKNTYAFPTIAAELRSMALVSLIYLARVEDREEDFQQVLTDIVTDPFELASLESASRYWANDPETEAEIISRYYYGPIAEITKAMDSGECFYLDYVEEPDRMVHSEQSCINGVLLPRNLGALDYPLIIDDLDYVWRHATEIANSYE